MKLLIIGRGRVGNALRRNLEPNASFETVIEGRRWNASGVRAADAVVLAVPDDSIETLANAIAPHLKRGATVLHCAGARGTDELRACQTQGAAVGVMHPLVSLPSRRRSPSFLGMTFCVHGSRRAISTSRRIAEASGAVVVVAQTGDPGYHAAAALAANGAAALAFVSVQVLERVGFDKRAAERAIGGLLRSVGDNVQRLGVPDSLTGPIARGDATTVERHRDALRAMNRSVLSTYDALLPVIVSCARAAGLTRSKASKILRLTKL